MVAKKETKHTRYDDKRKDAPRLPSSRITDEQKAATMEQLYLLHSDASKLDLIVDAARFALDNQEQFLEYRNRFKEKV
jgi:hypothetical protein